MSGRIITDFGAGEIAEGLADIYGVDDLDLDLAREIRSVVVGSDLEDSPYARIPIPCGENDTMAAAGAGVFNYCLARPGPKAILQILGLTIANLNAAADQYILRLLTPADVNTIDTETGVLQLIDTSVENETRRELASNLFSGRDASAGVGRGLASYSVMAGDTKHIVFPRPGFFIWGNGSKDRDEQSALGIVASLGNTILSVAYYCREWPLPRKRARQR